MYCFWLQYKNCLPFEKKTCHVTITVKSKKKTFKNLLAGDAAIAPNHDTNMENGRYVFFLQVKTLVLLNQNMQDGRSVRAEREAEEKINSVGASAVTSSQKNE